MDTASIWFYPVLFVTGLAAGFVDSIAGGGGLITVPVLLSTGFAPQDALGTNKLQAAFGSGSAAFHFAHAGLVRRMTASPESFLPALAPRPEQCSSSTNESPGPTS